MLIRDRTCLSTLSLLKNKYLDEIQPFGKIVLIFVIQ